eukprot:scaffold167799_cov31-Tisochrysis_lutea.AAC.1
MEETPRTRAVICRQITRTLLAVGLQARTAKCTEWSIGVYAPERRLASLSLARTPMRATSTRRAEARSARLPRSRGGAGARLELADSL